jgi:hydroxyacylglutathione hydrolase
MIVETSTHPQFVSNTFLVAHDEGGPAFFVDAGGPVEPLLEAADRLGLSPSHVLLTHHHFDHVSDTPKLRERWPGLRVLISPTEHELLAASGVEVGDLVEIEAGERLPLGRLEVQAVATPGHTSGMLSFVITEHGGSPDVGSGSSAPGAVFTGDTLFKDSVGGVRAPGHSTYEDLRESIMGTLMQLPQSTVIYPGHADITTVAREWESNPFIRVWRGLDPEGTEACTALDRPATLVLSAPDYDGGTKAWVRWEDGSDDIVPGSKVAPAA